MTKIKYRNMINNIALKLRLSGNTISKLRSTGGQSASAMIIGQYRAYKYSKMLMLLAVLIFCLIFFAVDIALGPYDLDFIKVCRIGTGDCSPAPFLKPYVRVSSHTA